MPLTLTRKPGQSIQIGPDIRVTVTETHGSKATIAIEAPQEVVILRDEVVDRMRLMEKVLSAVSQRPPDDRIGLKDFTDLKPKS